MLTLGNLSPQKGSRKNKKRVGRGSGTGHGKTSGKGHKGAKARAGASMKVGFEGGQMPLQRRLPKRGFNNPFKLHYAIVNLKDLECFVDDTVVDRSVLLNAGLIKRSDMHVKLLGQGMLTKKLIVSIDKISESARVKIEASGGCIKE
jgi:large subunit ribosomal protein L15